MYQLKKIQRFLIYIFDKTGMYVLNINNCFFSFQKNIKWYLSSLSIRRGSNITNNQELVQNLPYQRRKKTIHIYK